MVDLRAEVEEEWSERDADECEAWVRAFAEGAVDVELEPEYPPHPRRIR